MGPCVTFSGIKENCSICLHLFTFVYTRLVTRLHSSSDTSTLVYIRLHSSVTGLHLSTLVYTRLVTPLCFQNRSIFPALIRQKQPSRGIIRKRYSEIYRKAPMSKCDFNKVALQFYRNHTSAWLFSCIFAAYFRTPFSKNTFGWLILVKTNRYFRTKVTH